MFHVWLAELMFHVWLVELAKGPMYQRAGCNGTPALQDTSMLLS